MPVYDGERLFLLVFPLWAMLIGLGFGVAWAWARRPGRRCGRARRRSLLAQAYGVVALHPFGLSYYNALVGGLPGAERLGLELTYWGDAVDGVLLDRLAREAAPGAVGRAGADALSGAGGPDHRPAPWPDVAVILQDEAAARADWLVVSRRTAYWSPELAADASAPGRRVADPLPRRASGCPAALGASPADRPATVRESSSRIDSP